MTRRIRFTPWSRAALAAAALALGAPAGAGASQVPFVTQPPVSTATIGAFDARLGDLDGDGDLDVVPISENDPAVRWFENASGDGSAWTERTVATAPGSVRGAAIADVDHDGDLDLAAYATSDNAVVWFENAAGDASTWTTRPVAAKVNAESIAAADLDGDGDQDLLVMLQGPEMLGWYENLDGAGAVWSPRTMLSGAGVGFRGIPADIDGDGDQDVLAILRLTDAGALVWAENDAGDGSSWTVRTLATTLQTTYSVATADVDRDGDLDAIATGPGDEVAWYENLDGNGSSWLLRPVSTQLEGTTAIAPADVDGDGDLDLAISSVDAASVAWYENVAGDGSAWTTRTVTTTATDVLSLLVGDIDGDGDHDLVSTQQYSSSIAWYRHEAVHATACFVPGANLVTGAGRPYALAPADVDGDGDLDVVSGEELRAAWYENVAQGTSWVTHTAGTANDTFRSIAVADLDGDGDADVIGGARFLGRVFAFVNAAGDGSTWTQRTVATGLSDVWAVATADLDGDGDMDVLSTSRYIDRVAWYRNDAGDGSVWTPLVVSTVAPVPHSVHASDVDRDGDQDVVVAAFGATIAWHENLTGAGTTWNMHTIATGNTSYASVSADVDRDGDPDVVQTRANAPQRLWHESQSEGAAWTEHVVSATDHRADALAAADLDRDGDPDVATIGRIDGRVDWFGNTGGGSGWSPHLVTTVPGDSGTSVQVADLDRDGRPDLVGNRVITGIVEWHHNRGGQFGLQAVDQAPPTADNGQLVAMLRLTASHEGRAGDHDVELASLGLLFEAAVGDPLTSEEANALVESLRVYVDTNGNGVFDPSADALVVSLPTLALVGGVQTIAFADGDAALQLAPGTARSYFAVVELTANASQQVPNQFRLTHLGLGSLASTAEDRAFDLPLQPSCPADVASTFKQVVPVELSGFSIE
jgi:VCBS repeat protein